MCIKLSSIIFGVQQIVEIKSLTKHTYNFKNKRKTQNYSELLKRSCLWYQLKSFYSSALINPSTFVELLKWLVEFVIKAKKHFGNNLENGLDRSKLNGLRSKMFQTLNSSMLRILWMKISQHVKVEIVRKSIIE